MYRLHFLLGLSLGVLGDLYQDVGKEIESAAGGFDYTDIPGMEKRDGKFYLDGEEVVSISGMGGEEVFHQEPVKQITPVSRVRPVESISLVSQITPVRSSNPVSRLRNVLKKTPVDVTNLETVESVNVEEIESITPLENVEEVESIQEVVSKTLIPDEIAKSFLGDEPALNRVNTGEIKQGIEEITNKLRIKEKELVKLKEEMVAIQEELKALEISRLEEVQTIRQYNNAQEIMSMEKLRSVNKIKMMEELASMEEVISKQLVKTMTPVNVQELKSVIPLTDMEAERLRNMMEGYAH